MGFALEARERTGGRFDPTVHDAVAAAGYDRSFEQLRATGWSEARRVPRCAGRVEIDRESATITVEPGFRLDLGGIAKGYAVDRACSLLARAGGCLVNAGGDLAVSGLLSGAPWPVAVDVPGAPLTLAVARGGVATSGRDYRKWARDGVEQHHLIDPASGRPSQSDLLRVTVASETAVQAEVLAKSIFLAGSRRGRDEADALGIPCVLVTEAGDVVTCGGLA